MKVSVLQENLAKGLGIVGRAVASRSTLPVLSNILMATDGDRLKLSATNLEIGISCWLGAKVETEGAITIPGRLLSDLVNGLPRERVDLELDEDTQTLRLVCGRSRSKIKGISAEEFPVLALPPEEGAIELDVDHFRTMVNQVAFAAATDESRPILTGTLMRFGKDDLTMAAADGFRLSVKNQNGLAGLEEGEVIVPASALVEVQRIGSGFEGEKIRLYLLPTQKGIMFDFGDVHLISQLIEGEFPNYQNIIPESYATRSVVDADAFLKAARVCRLFARGAADIVTLEITPASDELMNGRITLTATNAEMGDNVAEVDASIEGDPVTVAFNVNYLMDVLGALDSPQVVLETATSATPGVFREIGDESYTHVIMPMHLNNNR